MSGVPVLTLSEAQERSREMSRRGLIGAHVLHSRYDSKEITTAARKAFLDRFERDVDPDGILDPAERSRRADHARKAYFSRLAYLSAKTRAAKRSPNEQKEIDKAAMAARDHRA